MRRQVAQLAALALHPQMRHAPALLAEVLHEQFGQLFAPERVVLQHREDGPVALALECVVGRRCQESARLGVSQRRRLAFVGPPSAA